MRAPRGLRLEIVLLAHRCGIACAHVANAA
jgi:hypothetical protein